MDGFVSNVKGICEAEATKAFDNDAGGNHGKRRKFFWIWAFSLVE